MGTRIRTSVAMALFVVSMALTPGALAQSCTTESEPNDTPMTAVALGELRCFTGELAGQDQDAWVWEVTEADAEVPWTMLVQGIRGQLTKVDVIGIQFTDDGTGVTSADTAFTHGTSTGAPNVSAPFVVTPGDRWFFGVSKSGGEGSYVVRLEPQRELRRNRQRLSRDEGTDAFGTYGVLEGTRALTWTISETDVDRRWGLELRSGLGADVTVTLSGPEGSDIGRVRADSGVGRLDSLGLTPGAYTLAFEGPAGRPVMVTLDAVPQGIVTDGDEVEPNNDAGNANLLPLGEEIVGGGGDRDVYAVDVDAEAADTAWDLTLAAEDNVSIVLRNAAQDVLLERHGTTGTVPNLEFDEGRYFVWVSAGRDVQYTLSLTEARPSEQGWEREPNDRLIVATPLPENLGARGSVGPQDVDVFRFETEGEPTLWRFQAIGDGAGELVVYNGGGVEQQRLRGEGRIRLDNVVLLPGTHYVSVGRGDGEYAVRALALGPAPEPEAQASPPSDEPLETQPAVPDAAADGAVSATTELPAEPAGPPPPPGRMERENNDDPSRAGLMVPGAVHVGRLAQGDVDAYRFFLPNDGFVRLEFVGPEASETFLEVIRNGDGRIFSRYVESDAYDLWLVAGDYFVEVAPDVVSDGYYQLRMTHRDPLAVPADLEPNDAIGTARRLPASGVVESTVGDRDRYDYFGFESGSDGLEIAFTIEGEQSRLWLYDRATRSGIEPEEELHEDGVMDMRYVLPPDLEVALRVTGAGPYRLTGTWPEVLDPGSMLPSRDEAIALDPADAEIPVTAYWHQGQVVETTVSLTHRGEEPTTYRLIAHPSSLVAQVVLPDVVDVGPNETVDVPVTIRLGPDVRDDQPLRIQIGAVDVATLETIGTTQIELPSSCEADPVSPQRVWPLPRLLLGELNVAWSAFGATVQEENREELIDGRSAPSEGEIVPADSALTVALAGEEPHTLLGTILDPLADRGPGNQLDRFRIETSLDGDAWKTVLEGRIAAARVEQAFVFEEPVEARFARLSLIASQAGTRDIAVGEWKLVAASEPRSNPFNLVDPSLGGDLVWTNVRPSLVEDILLADGASNVLSERRPRDLVWVLGFHHGRAAQIASLASVASPREGDHLDEVLVEVSTTSPTGPYETLATWNLSRGSLTFDAPVWARYLRFTLPGPEEGELQPVVLPDAIQVFERAIDGDYKSILGEWGGFGREAIYEVLTDSDDEDDAGTLVDGGGSLEEATPFPAAGVAEGTVSVPDDADWYRIDLPEDDNLLDVTISGTPGIDFRYRLYDAHGEPLVADVTEDGERVRLSAFVETPSAYLELWEPKRSVIFAWDTSGSVRPYQAITYAGLAGFARDVDAEREFVQLLAYDDPTPQWLLPYWSADPLRVQEAIQAFDRDADSSNSFNAMSVATDALTDRDGTRAILLITDAETGGFDLTPRLWELLHETRPRVFSFEVSTGSSDWTQDLMQSWAYVNDGHYSYARNVGDFDIGFRRASCKLRRAKGYRVEVATRYQAPPGPGTITVVPGPEAAKPAIEVILDASGSMGARLPDGTSRIDAALGTLQALVSEGIEEGTPFALRAFGHVTPSTCEQELVVPLEPLDREATLQAIADIEPKLLSQTPIADALRAAADDLAAAGGPVAIVLITDGEESCGGDPEAALAELRAAGVDVTLSIVSLALDDAAASERFASLAALGNGAYTDVGDPAELAAAIRDSLAVPFEVLGPDGSVLARGLVGGEPVSLERGVYTVRVPGSPPTLIRNVRVPGDSNTTVSVGD